MTLAYPIVTEKAMVILENVNQLSFIVAKEAKKAEIKAAVEKAVITFEEKNAAEEILSQLGIV